MPIKIRAAAKPDAGEVYVLLQQFVVSYKPNREKFDTQYSRLMGSKDVCFLVAAGEVLQGYALALRVPTLYANGDLWELQELMVAPEHRSQARSNGAVEVVVPSRRAGDYYLRHGFMEAASYYKLKLT